MRSSTSRRRTLVHTQFGGLGECMNMARTTRDGGPSGRRRQIASRHRRMRSYRSLSAPGKRIACVNYYRTPPVPELVRALTRVATCQNLLRGSAEPVEIPTGDHAAGLLLRARSKAAVGR
jgi:hypothetical protein